MPTTHPAPSFRAQRRRVLAVVALLAIAALAAFLGQRASSATGGGGAETRAAAQSAQSRPRPATVRCIYVQHGGAANGKAAAQIIREEAAAARATGARLHYVMEWAYPSLTWETWATREPAIAGISRDSFLAMSPESAPAQGLAAEARTVFEAWKRWRQAVLDSVRTTRSVGPGDGEFGAEIDRGLADCGDVLAQLWVEGVQSDVGVAAAEFARRDWQAFIIWTRAYRNFLYSQFCETDEALRALNAGDPALFHDMARLGLRIHRDSLRSRNEVMALTLKSVAALGSEQHPVRIVLFFGLAHACTSALRDALGDALTETFLPPVCGAYDNILDIYRDVDGFATRGDGADPDRAELSRLASGYAENQDPAFIRDRDDMLAALTPADIDAVITSLKSTFAYPLPMQFIHLRGALGTRLLSAHPDPASQTIARRWLARG